MNLLLAMSLILLVDVSGSVDHAEYTIQKQGIVEALKHPSVHRAIYNQRGICIAYIEFDNTQKVVVDWEIVETPEDANRFAALVADAGRSGSGSTNVYGAIVGAVSHFASSPCAGDRVLDVSGDGAHNTGGEKPDHRALGDVRINGLPIANEERDLPEWYQQNVVKDGFLLPITSFDDFPHAIRQKLAQEIAFGGLEPRLHAD